MRVLEKKASEKRGTFERLGSVLKKKKAKWKGENHLTKKNFLFFLSVLKFQVLRMCDSMKKKSYRYFFFHVQEL